MTFRDALKTKDFVVTAQAKLAEAPDAESLLRQVEILSPAVDAVHLPDTTEERMSGIAAAALLLQQGIDPILHMNCRDRNRIALQKDFMGAVALGVTSIMVMRGKKVVKSKDVDVRNVFDTTALQFMAYIQNLNQDEDSSLVSDFRVGANAEIFAPDDDWSPENLIRKCDAGANFVQLPICFDLGITRKYMTHIVASKLTHRINFIMALTPLPSAKMGRWVRDNVKGAKVPERVIKRMERASDPESEGIAICAELLHELTTIPGVSGANLVPVGKLEMIPAAIEASGVRK